MNDRVFLRTAIAVIGLGLSALLFIDSASANDGPFVFEYKTASLANPGNASALYKRLFKNAHAYCRHSGLSWTGQKLTERKCRKAVLADAVQAIASPELSRLHARREGSKRMRIR